MLAKQIQYNELYVLWVVFPSKGYAIVPYVLLRTARGFEDIEDRKVCSPPFFLPGLGLPSCRLRGFWHSGEVAELVIGFEDTAEVRAEGYRKVVGVE